MALNSGVGIVQNGLICHLDAGNIRSYPGFGTTWFDLSGNNFNYTLVSGPSFDSKNGSSIYFDGSNYAFCNMSWPSNFTFEIILRAQQNINDNFARIIGTGPAYEFEFAYDENTRQIKYYSGWNSTTEYIDYNKYYVDYVIAGQPKSELAPAVGYHNLDDPLDYELGDNYKQVSFYARPMERSTDNFVQMDRYIEEQVDEETTETHGVSSGQEEEPLPPPPGLVRQVQDEPHRTVYI